MKGLVLQKNNKWWTIWKERLRAHVCVSVRASARVHECTRTSRIESCFLLQLISCVLKRSWKPNRYSLLLGKIHTHTHTHTHTHIHTHTHWGFFLSFITKKAIVWCAWLAQVIAFCWHSEKKLKHLNYQNGFVALMCVLGSQLGLERDSQWRHLNNKDVSEQ